MPKTIGWSNKSPTHLTIDSKTIKKGLNNVRAGPNKERRKTKSKPGKSKKSKIRLNNKVKIIDNG
ncbi:hypothetical protein LG21E12_04050 [Lactococcus garvieae]|nr:hypothetical protein LG21E12_04050 [Lactococcus garvieae]